LSKGLEDESFSIIDKSLGASWWKLQFRKLSWIFSRYLQKYL